MGYNANVLCYTIAPLRYLTSGGHPCSADGICTLLPGRVGVAGGLCVPSEGL